MMSHKLPEIAGFLDAELRVSEVPDYPQALNGIQLENGGTVTRVACAVDFSLRTCREAVALEADLLVVHHGIFWGGARPFRGVRYQQLSELLSRGVAVYAAHLPLDVHPTLGNNALLAASLGLDPGGGFNRFQGIDVGLMGDSDMPTAQLTDRAREFARAAGGDVVVTPFDDSRRTRRWGLCTGAGASSTSIQEAIDRGIDTLVVGEGPHHTAVEAMDAELTVIYAGHYATETLGVRAVGELLAERFDLPWEFIHSPTGL
jgi:dinuclear metal center YbgI/SA1388 family protein